MAEIKNPRQKLAVWGENLAQKYLESHGYQPLARNVRTPYGEIDLVVRKIDHNKLSLEACDLTVFVEVKTRSSTSYGYPEQAVTPGKRAHLLAAAQEFIRTHPELDGNWRVDVIAILKTGQDTPPEILHFENAVTAE